MENIIQIKLILQFSLIMMCIYILFLLIISNPFTLLFKFAYKMSIGGIFLYILNFILENFNYNLNIGINILTAFISGYLGVFGVVAMIFIKSLI